MSGGGYRSAPTNENGWKRKALMRDIVESLEDLSFVDFRREYLRIMLSGSIPFSSQNWKAKMNGVQNHINGHSLNDARSIAETFESSLRLHRLGSRWKRVEISDDIFEPFVKHVEKSIAMFLAGSLSPYDTVGNVLSGFKELKSKIELDPGVTLMAQGDRVKNVCSRLLGLCLFERMSKNNDGSTPMISKSPGDALLKLIETTNNISVSLPVDEIDIVSSIHEPEDDSLVPDILVSRAVSAVLKDSIAKDDEMALWLGCIHFHHRVHDHCYPMSNNFTQSISEDMYVLTSTESTFDKAIFLSSLNGEQHFDEGKGWRTNLQEKYEKEHHDELIKIVAAMGASNAAVFNDAHIDRFMEKNCEKVVKKLLSVNPGFIRVINKYVENWEPIVAGIANDPASLKIMMDAMGLGGEILNPKTNKFLIDAIHRVEETLPAISESDLPRDML